MPRGSARGAGILTFFLPGIFSGGAKSIVMQISFVMLIFLLFSDQISGGGKVSEGQTASGGHPLPSCGRKPGFPLKHRTGGMSAE